MNHSIVVTTSQLRYEVRKVSFHSESHIRCLSSFRDIIRHSGFSKITGLHSLYSKSAYLMQMKIYINSEVEVEVEVVWSW